MENPQRTIAGVIEYSGLGLFTGEEVKLCLKPSPVNTGIFFTRSDLKEHPKVPASVETISNCERQISIKKSDIEIISIEHLMAAFAGLGIDNIEIEISGSEIPAGDGSSLLFTRLLKDAGIVRQDKPKKTFFLQKELKVTNGDASIIASPCDKGLLLSYILDFNGAYLNRQCFEIEITENSFSSQIAPARTFGLSGVVEEFKKKGLGKGVTDDNSLILHEDGSITKPLSMSPAELKFPDECIRHKILDIVGDLYLTNFSLHARIVATKSGHSLNALMARKIVEISEDQASN